MEKDLFYRPHVEPTRDYHSDGVVFHENVTNTPEQVQPDRPYTEMEEAYTRNINTIDRLLRIRSVLPLLPPKIIETVKKIIDHVIRKTATENFGPIVAIIVKEGGKPGSTTPAPEDPNAPVDIIPVTTNTPSEATPEDVTETPATYTIPTSGTPDEDGDYEWPEMESSGFDIEVEENKNIWEMAEDQYLIDSSYIKENFSIEYNDILERYIYQLLTAMDEVGVESPESLNVEYEGDTVTGIAENDQHLNDIIVRNQAVINDMSDLFQITHDYNTTQEVLGAFDTVAQERIRYLKERYNDASAQTYLEVYDKTLLASSRNQYEERYVAARTEAYKFLHSTVVLSDQMLQLALASNLAKCSLLKKGVDIFAKKEYQNESYENTASTVNNTSKTENNTDKANENKATDTKAQENKGSSSNINIEDFSVGGGFGGTIKNQTQNAAQGITKTVTENGQVKVKSTATQIDAQKAAKEKSQGA